MRTLRVVVSSPSDVANERTIVRWVAGFINDILKILGRDCRIDLVLWETHAHPGLHVNGPQGKIDADLEIQQCDLLIGIFWKHFGTPVRDALSGTEHEIRVAYRHWQQHGTPQIWLYFNQAPFTPRSVEETEQLRKVLEFKAQFSAIGLYKEYSDALDFQRQVLEDLADYVLAPPTPKISIRDALGPHLSCSVFATPTVVAAEGLTEVVGDILLRFESTAPTATKVDISVFLIGTVVTNRLSDSENGAVLLLGGVRPQSGVISGNSVRFNGVELNIFAKGEPQILRVTNLRANASVLSAPAEILALVVLEGEHQVAITNSSVVVARVQQSLVFSVRDGDNSGVLDGPVRLSQSATSGRKRIATLRYSQAFPGAFLPRGTVDHGVRLRATFHSVPSGVSLWVTTNCVGIPAGPVPKAALTHSDIGPFRAVPPDDIIDGAPVAELAIGDGHAVAVWEVDRCNVSAVEHYDFGVYVDYDANPTQGQPAPGFATVAGGLAPAPPAFNLVTGAASSRDLPVPRFVDTSKPRTLFEISLRKTWLLFPFVTNQSGLDTGLTVANTSLDPLGTAPRHGQVRLHFYGTNAPDPIDTMLIRAGQVFTTLASADAPNFQGYVIAECDFDPARGVAYVGRIDGSAGAVYVAEVIYTGP